MMVIAIYFIPQAVCGRMMRAMLQSLPHTLRASPSTAAASLRLESFKHFGNWVYKTHVFFLSSVYMLRFDLCVLHILCTLSCMNTLNLHGKFRKKPDNQTVHINYHNPETTLDRSLKHLTKTYVFSRQIGSGLTLSSANEQKCTRTTATLQHVLTASEQQSTQQITYEQVHTNETLS